MSHEWGSELRTHHSSLSTLHSSVVLLALAEEQRAVVEVAGREELVGALDQAIVHVGALLLDQAARVAHRAGEARPDEQVGGAQAGLQLDGGHARLRNSRQRGGVPRAAKDGAGGGLRL